MSVRTLVYWLTVIALTVGGFVYGWPRERPTFTREIWMPDPEIKRDPALVSQWLENPAGPWGFADFRQKGERRQYKSVWVLTTPVGTITEKASDDWRVLYLGSQGGQTIESATFAVGDHISLFETWTRPVSIASARLEGSTLIIQTGFDPTYTVKVTVGSLALGLVIVWFLATIFQDRPRTYFLQFPVRRVQPKPTAPPSDAEKGEAVQGVSSSPAPKLKSTKAQA